MYCPACGARNPDDARFCNHCGVRQPAAAVPSDARPIGQAPGSPPGPTSGAVPGPAPAAPLRRLPTMGDGADAITLPMSGPSPRTLALGGAGLALGGLLVGGVVAWRAARSTATPAAPALPESHVEMIELPHLLRAGADAAADAGSVAAADAGSVAAATSVPSRAPSAVAATPSRARVSTVRMPARPATSDAPPREATAPTLPPAATAPGVEPPPRDQTTPAPATASGATASTDATGVLTSAEIQAVYRVQRLRLGACQLLVSGGGETVGALRMRVRVGIDGSVLRASTLSNTTGNEMLSRCVQNAVREWRFPAPRGGEAEFEYTLGFGA